MSHGFRVCALLGVCPCPARTMSEPCSVSVRSLLGVGPPPAQARPPPARRMSAAISVWSHACSVFVRDLLPVGRRPGASRSADRSRSARACWSRSHDGSRLVSREAGAGPPGAAPAHGQRTSDAAEEADAWKHVGGRSRLPHFPLGQERKARALAHALHPSIELGLGDLGRPVEIGSNAESWPFGILRRHRGRRLSRHQNGA